MKQNIVSILLKIICTAEMRKIILCVIDIQGKEIRLRRISPLRTILVANNDYRSARRKSSRGSKSAHPTGTESTPRLMTSSQSLDPNWVETMENYQRKQTLREGNIFIRAFKIQHPRCGHLSLPYSSKCWQIFILPRALPLIPFINSCESLGLR